MIDFFQPLINFASYVLPFLFVLTVVVFVHELGHFWVGRLCKARVDVFSVGFGKAIRHWTDKTGTVWKIGWLPLGGYVKFTGDENEASAPDAEKLAQMPEAEREGLMFYKPLWQRAAIVAAGPLANFLLAIVIFAALYASLGQRVTRPIVEQVAEYSAAARGGLQRGDVIQAIDGVEIESFGEVRRLVMVNPERDLTVAILRGARQIELAVRPDRFIETDRFGNEYSVGRLGISASTHPDHISHKRYGVLPALGKGIAETAFIIEQTFVILGRIISGRESADNLGGPVRIAQISGQTATLGLVALVDLIAILSVSIGLVNLFPIPILDGGHLVFYAIEAARGRPLSARAQQFAMKIGLVLVMTLFLFVTWNDLSRLLR